MIKHLLKRTTVLLAIIFALTAPLSIATASNIADGVCRGILSSEGAAPADPDQPIDQSACLETGDQSFSQLVRNIINVFSIVVGAVSVIMIIVGGFRYIISGGDSAGVSSAKNTILYAIVGLVIVLFAQVIIRFVYSSVSPNTTTGGNTNSQTAN